MAENTAARKIQAAFRLSRKFRFVLYNGTIDIGRTINPTAFFTSFVERPPKEVKEVSIVSQMSRTGQLQKGASHSLSLASWTREYGVKGDTAKSFACNIKIFYGGVSHSVTLYKNGKIQYAGGYPLYAKDWYTTPKNVLNIVFPGQFKTQDIILNNVMLQRSTGRIVRDMTEAARIIGGSYEPEMRTFIKIEKPRWTIQIFKRGIIQILKPATPNDIKPAEEDANRLFSKLKTVLGGAVERQRVPVQRLDNRPAPEIKRRTTTVPKNKQPVPFSFAGTCPNGMYLAPNPQGEPQCYKIPVRIAYMKPKIIERFEKFGLRIPQKTKSIFGIDVNNVNRPVNVSGKDAGYRFTLERIQRSEANKRIKTGDYDRTVFKIDSRQALRYTSKQLVDICMRLGLVKYSKTTSRKILADAIESYAENKGLLEHHEYNPNGVPRNRNYSGTGATFKVGKRLCMSYSKPALAKITMRVYGKRLDTQKTLKELCQEVEGLAHTKALSSASSGLSNFERELVSAMAMASSPKKNKFSNMTVKQLRGYLSSQGIKQTARDKESLIKLARNPNPIVKSPPLKNLLEFAKYKGFYVRAGMKKEQVKNLLEKHIAAKKIQNVFRSRRKVVTPPPSPPKMQMMAYAPVESMNSPSPPKNLSRNNARNILKAHLKRSNFTNIELDNFRTQASRYMKYSADPSKHIRRLMKNMFG